MHTRSTDAHTSRAPQPGAYAQCDAHTPESEEIRGSAAAFRSAAILILGGAA